MRAVDDDVEPVEAVRQRGQKMHDVAVLGIRESRHAPHVTAGGLELGAGHGLFDALLDDVGQLHSPAGEDLDAVVGRGVVRGRDHHAEVGVDVVDEEGRRRSGEGARLEHVDARRGEARLDGGGEELPRDARVARDHRGEAFAGGLAGRGDAPLAQDDSGRLGQGECQVGGEGAVREPPHTVRPEQRHRI